MKSKKTMAYHLSNWLIATGVSVIVFGAPLGVFIYFWPKSWHVSPENAAMTGLCFSASCILLGAIFSTVGELMSKKIHKKNKEEISA